MRTILSILSLTLALGIPATAGAASGPASVVPATRVVVFHPAGASGTPVKGNCWTESIALIEPTPGAVWQGTRFMTPASALRHTR